MLVRWVKLFKPLAYFSVGTTMGYLPEAFGRVCQPSTAPLVLSDADLFGIGDEDTYAKKRERRFQSSWRWLIAQDSAMKQSVGATLLIPLVSMMGRFFAQSKFENSGEKGVLEFCR
jgi:hypothetical protein